ITRPNTIVACYDSSEPMAGTTLGAITRALLEYDRYREGIKVEFVKLREEYGVSDGSFEAVAAAMDADTLIAAFRNAKEATNQFYQSETAERAVEDPAVVSYWNDTEKAEGICMIAKTYSSYLTKEFDELVDRRQERWEECLRTLQLLPYNSEDKKALATKLSEQWNRVRDEKLKIHKQLSAHL